MRETIEYINGVKVVSIVEEFSAADVETIVSRKSICSSCIFYIEDPAGEKMCESCGCLINVITVGNGKTCPEGKW